MKVKILSAKGYADKTANNGDCIIVDTGTKLVIYDCGCQEHAQRVLDYMSRSGYSKCDVVLSHNDADHFDGLPHLIDAGVVSKVYTLLLLKHKTKLLKLIGDGRVTEESLVRKIKEKYDNIYSLGGKVELVDALELPSLCTGVKVVGPEKDAALAAVAKFLDNREGDTIDGETIYNAICFQVRVTMNDGKYLLLCGDSSYHMAETNLKTATYIQLPHHGKYEIAEKIFELKDSRGDLDTKYFVSDNTGSTNGGSDTLKKKRFGRSVTFTDTGDIDVSTHVALPKYVLGKSLGVI